MRLFGRLLTAFMIVVAFVVGCALFAPSTAHAEVWNHKAYSSLAKNSPSKAKYVQGTCYDGTRYAYTVKQNSSKHQMLWRSDMRKGGKAKKMSVSAKAKKAIYHGNDMEYVKVGGKRFLLVAPCKAKSRYVQVLEVNGLKVTYWKRIYCGFTNKVSAIARVSQDGWRVKVIMGKNKKLWMVTLDLRWGTYYKKHGRVYGYVSNQGISYNGGYLYACDGGYKSRYANVRKYRLVKSGSNWRLQKVWTRKIKGECEGTFTDRAGKLCLAMEGKWHWGYGDRIVRWAR